MRLRVKDLQKVIKEAMSENFGGKMRHYRGGGKKQYNPGKVEDENKEVSFSEAEQMFPDSTNAWAEIVPALFPEFPFDDPKTIKMKSLFFLIGGKLRVTFDNMPQVELAEWDPDKQDWVELELDLP